MTLSKRQREVIDLMGEGWELARSMGFDCRYWIQKGGAGYGGESKNVNANTGYSLYKKGLIEVNVIKYPRETYKLTDKAKGL